MNIRSTSLSVFVGTLFAVSTTLASAISPANNVSTEQDYFKYLVVAEAHQHQEREGRGEGKRGQGRSDHAGHGDGGSKHGSNKMQGHGHGHGHKHGHGHGSYAHNVASQAEELDLSDEQLGKIARLHMKDDRAHKLLKRNLQKSMQALRKAIMEPGSDDEAIRKLGQAHVNEFNAMIKHHIQERKAVHDVLTPEQVEKLKSMKAGHDHGH